MNLDDVFKSGGVVLIDGSLRSAQRGEDLGRQIYGSSSYSGLNKEALSRSRECVSKMIRAFQYPNAFTIPEVVGELADFERILSSKLSFLRTKQQRKFEHKNEASEQELAELQEKVFALRSIAKRKTIAIPDARYILLLDMVRTLDKAIELKKVGWRDTKYQKEIRDSNTDESLVATLYYQAMFSGESASLLSADTDFIRLLGVTPRLMGSSVFHPYNQAFRSANPWRLYHCENGEIQDSVRSVDLSPSIEFKIFNRSDEENEEVFRDIMLDWQLFYHLGVSKKYNHQARGISQIQAVSCVVPDASCVV